MFQKLRSGDYLSILRYPFDLLRTKKVLKVNPNVIPARKETKETKIFVFDYSAEQLQTQEVRNVHECYKYLESPHTSWINVDGIRKSDVEEIGNHFGVHPLIIEDILSVGQRPKMDEINGLIFCLLNMLSFNETTKEIESEQISIILGNNFVISFQEEADKDVFNPIRDKINIGGSKIRQNKADYLFYSLIDMIVDNYFVVMEKFGDSIEALEEDIIRYGNKNTLSKVNSLRKEMIFLKRSISPVREVINGILRSESELIEDKTSKYFKDVYDHIIQSNELADNYRDMMINLQDLYLNNVNLRMNEVMKVMAIVTCLLAPATVIGGIFGMNFEKIPWLHNDYGFVFAVSIMLVIPIWMLWMFKRKGWF